MANHGNVLVAIKNAYSELFEQEKKVADYILENYSKVINMTVTELSDKSNVSDATVMRLCKKVGCSGFYNLKIALAKDMSDEHVNISESIRSDDIEQSVKNILLYQSEQIKQCINLIDHKTVKECINLINKCDTLYIFAAGNTNPLAVYAAYQFSQSGIKTVVNISPEMQINTAFTAKENDLCLIISDSGSTKLISDIHSICKNNYVKIIAITSFPNSPLGKSADYILNTIDNTKVFFHAHSSSRLIHMAIIDLLTLLILKEEKSSAFKHNNQLEEYLSKFKI